MLQMSVDTREIERRLSAVASKQLPFAVALGINDVAGQIVQDERAALSGDLDRPAPFTLRGLTVQRASKRRLVGVVGFKPIQAQYLARQATGGKRTPKGRAIVVPVGQRLNKYGNMPRGAIKRALARPDGFSGTVRGVSGVWKRKGAGRGLKLLAIYADAARYKPRLRFVTRARNTAATGIGPAVARRLAYAMKTAR